MARLLGTTRAMPAPTHPIAVGPQLTVAGLAGPRVHHHYHRRRPSCRRRPSQSRRRPALRSRPRSRYLALATLVSLPDLRPDGVILVAEAGRSLSAADTSAILGIPVVATVPVRSSIARLIDAGLFAGRPSEIPGLGHLSDALVYGVEPIAATPKMAADRNGHGLARNGANYLLTELHQVNTQVRGHAWDPPLWVDVLLDNRPHDRRAARAIKRSGHPGGAPGRQAGGHRRPVGALPARRCGRGAGGGGVDVVPGSAGGGPVGGHGSLLRDGPAAVVPVPVGGRGGLGSGDAGRGTGLLPLAAGGRQAGPGALASPGRGQRSAARRRFGQGLCGVGACAQRDGAAWLLRLPP